MAQPAIDQPFSLVPKTLWEQADITVKLWTDLGEGYQFLLNHPTPLGADTPLLEESIKCHLNLHFRSLELINAV